MTGTTAADNQTTKILCDCGYFLRPGREGPVPPDSSVLVCDSCGILKLIPNEVHFTQCICLETSAQIPRDIVTCFRYGGCAFGDVLTVHNAHLLDQTQRATEREL